LGPSIEPEKPSVKSASTPYPPRNDVFIAILYLGTRLFVFFNNFMFGLYVAYCLLLFLYWYKYCTVLYSFSVLKDCSEVVYFLDLVNVVSPSILKQRIQSQSKKGPKALKQGIFGYCALIYRDLNHDGLNLITTQFIRRKHRP
jgi:hypothetical protein